MDDIKEPFQVLAGHFEDPAGAIGILEDHQVPFKVLRTFWIYRVPENSSRGGHAHKTSEQLLMCVDGVIEIELEDLQGVVYRFNLSDRQGIYIPCKCWGKYTFRKNAKALCLASDYFDETDYIRDYNEFEKLKNEYSDN